MERLDPVPGISLGEYAAYVILNRGDPYAENRCYLLGQEPPITESQNLQLSGRKEELRLEAASERSHTETKGALMGPFESRCALTPQELIYLSETEEEPRLERSVLERESLLEGSLEERFSLLRLP
jgi:hypothetical protein